MQKGPFYGLQNTPETVSDGGSAPHPMGELTALLQNPSRLGRGHLLYTPPTRRFRRLDVVGIAPNIFVEPPLVVHNGLVIMFIPSAPWSKNLSPVDYTVWSVVQERYTNVESDAGELRECTVWLTVVKINISVFLIYGQPSI